MYGFFWDPTYIFILIGFVISVAASGFVNSTFKKYNQVDSKNDYTGTQAAQYILRQENIDDVGVLAISGELTDNYNAQKKILSLSQSTANSRSVAAISVAAHECGHAVQDSKDYLPLKMRASLVPVANFGSAAAFPIIILGVFMSWNQTLINVGIFAFSLALIFQLVTLPVEFNASRRALKILSDGNILTAEEMPMARKVLTAAALTYVAAAFATFLQLFRLILLFGGNNRRD